MQIRVSFFGTNPVRIAEVVMPTVSIQMDTPTVSPVKR